MPNTEVPVSIRFALAQRSTPAVDANGKPALKNHLVAYVETPEGFYRLENPTPIDEDATFEKRKATS
jgi:hypothetical protein